MAALLAESGKKRPRTSNGAGEGAPRLGSGAPEKPKWLVGGAFGEFLREKRSEISSLPEFKGASAVPVVRAAHDRFKELDEATRKQYEEKWEQAKREYTKKMDAFLMANGKQKTRASRGTGEGARRLSSGVPEKPTGFVGGAFGEFLREKRSEISSLPEFKGASAVPVVKAAHDRFKALDEATRKQYEEKWEQAKKEYTKKMDAFLTANGKKKPRTSRRLSSGAPEKPKWLVGGAFGEFLREKRSEISSLPELKGANSVTVVKAAHDRFKALDEATRKQYEEKWEQAKRKYSKDMAAFLVASGGEKPNLKREGVGDDSEVKKRKSDPPIGGGFRVFLHKYWVCFADACEGRLVDVVTQFAAHRWEELSEADKQAFGEEYVARKAVFRAKKQAVALGG